MRMYTRCQLDRIIFNYMPFFRGTIATFCLTLNCIKLCAAEKNTIKNIEPPSNSGHIERIHGQTSRYKEGR
jgi:hypothetical protein